LKKLLLSAIFLLPLVLHSQVLINEVSSASVSAYLDEDTDQEDWIEFYNPSSSPIDMYGYTITSTEGGKTDSWTFPHIIIKPNDYLTVFCSGKNRREYFDHWEVPVYAAMPWKYYLGSSDPPAAWRQIGFNDASWSVGAAGIGYGDGDDSTLTPPVNSVFLRSSFFVADTSKIPTAALLLDYDDAFVAYLNDVEIARANIGIYGDHPAYYTSAYDEHEAVMYTTGGFSAAYFVDPTVVDSAIKPGINVFSIQVHNYSGGMDDLSAIPYFLIGVNDTAVTYYPFPAVVNLHTNFQLNSGGQTLTLTDPSGAIADSHIIGGMQLNNSFGRRPNGGNNWYYFDSPTPDTSNNTSAFYTGYISKPAFTLPAGFYPSAQLLSIYSTSGVIRYTLDGSDPGPSSTVYTAPFLVPSTTVVRARSYSTDPLQLPSEVITNTYFINENVTLPVISLVSDPYNLFDYNYGIYVYGPNADTITTPFFGSNFWNGWERPSNIEYFEKNGGPLGFETPAAISIQGNYSKSWPQRGFTVKAKENYNAGPINFPLFPDKADITQFKNFNIRNAGSDWNTAHMRDRLNQKTAQKKTHLDVMDGRPCVLFINGNYWGVYEIREKQDADYIENNSGVKKDEVDFLEFDGSVIEGNNKAFRDMVTFVYSNDMSLPANYQTVKGMLDIENFADYFITETYCVNIDWLGSYTNNIKFWKEKSTTGRWRYMLWDTDLSLGFGAPLGTGRDTMNMLAIAINPVTPNPHSAMLKGLLDNLEFRNYFVNRYADLLNTIYQPLAIKEKAFALRDEMKPEMTRHFARWGGTSPMAGFIGRADTEPEWEAEVDSLWYFAAGRIGPARNYIQSQFGLTKQVDVTLDVQPAGAGTIKINTIVPDSLPWTGVYFDGVPVTITANENPGYSFKYWQSNVLVASAYSDKSMSLNISSDDQFTAYFEELEDFFDAYPNPFTDEVTLTYKVPERKQVSIKIFNSIGQLVAVPVSDDTYQEEGIHTVKLDCKSYGFGNGIYQVVMQTKDFSRSVKLVRTKAD
jgi:hypothetical protein